jgi:hypothetical protein
MRCQRGGYIRVRMGEIEYADWGKQDRRRKAAAEQFDGCVAARHVAKHAGDDRNTLERLAVGAHRLLCACAAGDIGERFFGHRSPRPILEPHGVKRNLRAPTCRSRQVDLRLPLASQRHATILHLQPPKEQQRGDGQAVYLDFTVLPEGDGMSNPNAAVSFCLSRACENKTGESALAQGSNVSARYLCACRAC